MTTLGRGLFLVALILATSVSLFAQDRPDFSGSWVWKNRRVPHPLVIEQNATDLVIRATGLTEGRPVETYRLDGSSNVYDSDFGAYWVRAKTRSEWEGATLIVTTKQAAGWWKNGGPDTINVDESPKQTERVLELDSSGTRLTIRSTVNYGTFADVLTKE